MNVDTKQKNLQISDSKTRTVHRTTLRSPPYQPLLSPPILCGHSWNTIEKEVNDLKNLSCFNPNRSNAYTLQIKNVLNYWNILLDIHSNTSYKLARWRGGWIFKRVSISQCQLICDRRSMLLVFSLWNIWQDLRVSLRYVKLAYAWIPNWVIGETRDAYVRRVMHTHFIEALSTQLSKGRWDPSADHRKIVNLGPNLLYKAILHNLHLLNNYTPTRSLDYPI